MSQSLGQYCGFCAWALMLRPHNRCMKTREDVPQAVAPPERAGWPQRSQRVPRTVSPSSVRGIRVLAFWLWHAWVKSSSGLAGRVLLLVAGLCQIALLLATCYLIDLSVSLMGLWAELARKHLELTM